MYRKELLIISCFIFSLLLALNIGTLFSVGASRKQAKLLTNDCVVGFSLASQAIDRIIVNWNETYRLISIPETDRRLDTIQRVNGNSTQAIWDQYAIKPKKDDEKAVFENLVQVRREFLQLRDQYFDMLMTPNNGTDRTNTARFLLVEKLLPAYDVYLQTAMELLRINSRSGFNAYEAIGQRLGFAQYTSIGSAISTVGVCAYIWFQLNLGSGGIRIPNGQKRNRREQTE